MGNKKIQASNAFDLSGTKQTNKGEYMKTCYGRRCYSANFLFLIVFLFSMFGCSSSSPENATKKFLSLLKEGRHLEAQAQTTTNFREMFGGDGNAIKVIIKGKRYYRSDRLKDFRIVKSEEEDKVAVTTVEITTVDGQKYDGLIWLRKEEGKWKIQNF